jgi:hypothetical protein
VNDVPLNLVQARLGHSTITMTMRYAHLAPDHVASSSRWRRLSRCKPGAKPSSVSEAATKNPADLN